MTVIPLIRYVSYRPVFYVYGQWSTERLETYTLCSTLPTSAFLKQRGFVSTFVFVCLQIEFPSSPVPENWRLCDNWWFAGSWKALVKSFFRWIVWVVAFGVFELLTFAALEVDEGRHDSFPVSGTTGTYLLYLSHFKEFGAFYKSFSRAMV